MRITLLGLALSAVLASPSLATTETVSSLPVPLLDVDALAPTPSPSPRPKRLPVVSHKKLIPFLPKPPKGWSADPISASTNELEDLFLSTASRVYQKGDDENAPVAIVTIIDAGGHKGYFDALTSRWKDADQNEEALTGR